MKEYIKNLLKGSDVNNNLDDIEFMDDEKRARIKESKPLFRRALHLIMLFIIMSLIWAYFAKLDEITRASGKVIASSKTQVIQYLEGGILAELLVKEGDIVNKGQILLKIDDTRFMSDHQENRRKYLALLGSISRLKAEVAGHKKIIFPQILITEAPEVIKSETNLFDFRRDQLQSNLNTYKKTYKLAKRELNITEPLVRKGLMSELESIRLKRQVAELEGKIDSTQDEYNSQAQKELTEQEGKLSSLEAALMGMKDRMLRTTIKSPVYGKIIKINVNTINSVIQPGVDIMEILPLDDTLLVEAKVKPSDIAFLHPGQSATIKFSAYDYAIYGGIKGSVSYISADTIQDSKEGKEEEYYRVVLTTNENHLKSRGGNLPIIPGMLVSVDILTGEKSVLDYLLKPILRAHEKALTER